MTNTAPITLEQLFRFYRGLPHQAAAIKELGEDIEKNGFVAAMRRDRPWFRTWSVDGKLQDPVALALPLVQAFEGCELTAYPDPKTGGEPFTIGWGTTTYASGKPVRPGDTITQRVADELLDMRLRNDLLRLSKRIPRWDTLTAHQQAALLSFAYNVGANFYAADGYATITARLRDGLLDQVPAAMMLYVNPGTNVEAGLRRRREAEGRLWRGEGVAAADPAKAPKKILPHLTLTRTGRVNGAGLELLELARVVDGITMDKLTVTSGAPGRQKFETGARSQAGGLTPLPEGRWRIGKVEWKANKGDWSASWGPGLGAVWIALEYDGPGRTARSAIGFHLDANEPVAPGSAGCVVLSSRKDVETLIRWLEGGSIDRLYVNWKRGTCPQPKTA